MHITSIRPEVKNTPWKLSKHEFYTAYHYALQYADWKVEKEGLYGLKGLNYDGMPHGSGISDSTQSAAMKIAELESKMLLVEETAKEADDDLASWILKGVTSENATYNYLSMVMHIPCSANTYYDRRRKFYYLLSKKIGEKY